MRRTRIQGGLLVTHTCLMFIFLGGAVLETVVYFPNWLHDIPTSLTNARAFLVFRNPGQFFQAVTPLSLLLGIAFVALGRGAGSARMYVAVSVTLIVLVEALTFSIIYPGIRILLREGPSVHSADVLRQTAEGFMPAHWFRMAAIVIASALSMTGVIRFFGSPTSSIAAARRP